MLCGTAQQSYCSHAGIRCLSVNPVFSETVKRINAQCWETAWETTCPPYLQTLNVFFFLKFQNFDFL